jgi:DMSO reductase family type II enzyme chaperone
MKNIPGPARSRSLAYGLLAQALRYPDAALFDALRGGGWARELLEEAPFLTGVQRTMDALPARLAELQGQHTALFSSGSLCSHQESDFTGGNTFQKADIMADVAGFYAAFGVRVSATQRELPDFLGAELEFLHLASWKEAEAMRRGRRARAALCREVQEKFLAEHLGRWIPLYRDRLAASPAGPFYVALAGLVADFINAQGVTAAPILPVLPATAPEPAAACEGCEV